MLTVKELKRKYKVVPAKTHGYEGRGGVIIAGLKERFRPYRLIIDERITNVLVIGCGRSGKTEMFTFPMIDMLSRASKKANMVIHDRNGDLAKSSAETLRKRGYDVLVVDYKNPVNTVDTKYRSVDPVVVFVTTSFYDRESLQFASEFIGAIGSGISNGKTTHFLLDDFVELPMIKEMPELVFQSLEHNVHYHFVIQHLGQLKMVYGRFAGSIMRSCSHQITYLKEGGSFVRFLSRELDSKGELVWVKSMLNNGVSKCKFRWEYLLEDFK